MIRNAYFRRLSVVNRLEGGKNRLKASIPGREGEACCMSGVEKMDRMDIWR
jgi:hypothetical protein